MPSSVKLAFLIFVVIVAQPLHASAQASAADDGKEHAVEIVRTILGEEKSRQCVLALDAADYDQVAESCLHAYRERPSFLLAALLGQWYQNIGRLDYAYNFYELCLVAHAQECANHTVIRSGRKPKTEVTVREAQDELAPHLVLMEVAAFDGGAEGEKGNPIGGAAISIDRVDDRGGIPSKSAPGVVAYTSLPTPKRSAARMAIGMRARGTPSLLTAKVCLTHPDFEDHCQLQKVRANGLQISQIAPVLKRRWAELTVVSNPAGARVIIDDEEIPTRTPARIKKPTGQHSVLIRLPGYKPESKETILRVPGETVSVALSPDPDSSAVLSILSANVSADADVTLSSGRVHVDVPGTAVLLPGTAQIEVHSPNHKSFFCTAPLEAGRATRVSDVELANTQRRRFARWIVYPVAAALVVSGAALGISALVQRNAWLDSDAPTRTTLDQLTQRSKVADVLLLSGMAAGVSMGIFELVRRDRSTGHCDLGKR